LTATESSQTYPCCRAKLLVRTKENPHFVKTRQPEKRIKNEICVLTLQLPPDGRIFAPNVPSVQFL
jgi:hypothetical protein